MLSTQWSASSSFFSSVTVLLALGDYVAWLLVGVTVLTALTL
jgi:hypothetical protein